MTIKKARGEPLAATSWWPEILRRNAIGIALAVVSPALHVQPGWAGTTSYSTANTHVVVTSGRPTVLDAETRSVAKDYIRVVGHVRNDIDCHEQKMPKFVVTQQPWHGVLCFRDVPGVILYSGNGRRQCLGKPSVLRTIFYRPKIGFVGKDSFGYDAVYEKSDRDTIGYVDITVTAPPTPSKTDPPSISEGETQLSPIPPCTLDLM